MEFGNILDFLKYTIAAVGVFIGFFIGEINGFVYALVCMVAVDYITGVLSAMKSKSLSSETGFWGLVRKALIFALVGVGNCVDVYVIQDGAVIRTAIIFFYLSNEGLSILENAAALGVLFPEKVREVLAQLKDKGGKGKP